MFAVTIDGKAGCGKSTLADELSKILNLKKFNTGAVYRGITCEYMKQFGDLEPTMEGINAFVNDLAVDVVFDGATQKIIVNGNDYTPYLREEVISNFVAKVSPFNIVREKVREIQRNFAEYNDCIMEGRDIGTVVLPNAQCKLFVTASSEVRAKRRFEQLKDAENAPTYEEILNEINDRDHKDINREHGALLPAKDGIIIDNSDETLEQTVNRCKKIIEDRQKEYNKNK
ncbi:MAG: (d)CMP kinase [Clostridia bacterium]|nr:(d)CMP kinase [Clostridia bacterium]